MQPIQLGAPSPTGLPRTWKPPCPFGEHHLRMLERRNGGDASSDDDDDVGAEAAVDDDDRCAHIGRPCLRARKPQPHSPCIPHLS